MRNLILFIILSSLLSCHSPGKNEVNLLILKLSYLENSIQEINSPAVSTALEGYKENIDLVKKCVDSIDNKFIQKINNYKGIRKACPDFFNKYRVAIKNLESQNNQLKDFKYDISNNIISLDSISFFIELEERNVQRISDDILNLLELYNFIVSTNDSLYFPIKQYAEKQCL